MVQEPQPHFPDGKALIIPIFPVTTRTDQEPSHPISSQKEGTYNYSSPELACISLNWKKCLMMNLTALVWLMNGITPHLHLFCGQIWWKEASDFFLSNRPFELCLRDIHAFITRITLQRPRFLSVRVFGCKPEQVTYTQVSKNGLWEGHGELTDQRNSLWARLWKSRAQSNPGQTVAEVDLCSGMYPPITFFLSSCQRFKFLGNIVVSHLLAREE